MSKILGLSAKKQGGKNTSANFVLGLHMQSLGIIDMFRITDKGELWIDGLDGDKNTTGIFDVTSRHINKDIDSFCKDRLDPYIKLFSLADPIKKICIDVFGVTPNQVYGTDDEKNSKVKLTWDDISSLINIGSKTGHMTARELLQVVGTEVYRKLIYDDVWVDACLNQIQRESPDISIITDVRFPNEVLGIQKANGKVIRFTRSPFKDSHDSETSLNKENFNWNVFDYIIDNAHMNIGEQNKALYDILYPEFIPFEIK